MALSDPKTIYGICTVTPYNRSTQIPYGILRVLGNSSLSLTGETIDLFGGCSAFPWDSQKSTITAEISMLFREYPDFVFELFLGKKVTTNAAETTGYVSPLANASGSSVFDAGAGIASIAATVGDEADLKFGRYVIEAASATEVNIYLKEEVDASRGTTVTYIDDSLKIVASQVIGNGATVILADLGLTITGGTTVGFTVGDTAYFEVRPVNKGSRTVVIGNSSDVFPEWGADIVAAKKSNQELVMVEVFRAIAVGMPINFNENTFSESEVTAKALYDSGRGGVFKFYNVA